MPIFLALLTYDTLAYTRSLYAPNVNDYIIQQNADTFYFLQNITTPPKSKPISDAGFTTQAINKDSYGWPDHDRTGDQALEEEEGLNMKNFYENRVNLTQEDMYYHPAAAEEFWTTWDVIDSLQRSKEKVTLNPKYLNTRTTNLYMPPGELITFEILPEAVGLVTVRVNYHRQEVSLKDRYKYLQCSTKLTQTKSTWGWPMGGAVTFELSGSGYPVEINVTGCVIAPYFEYGVSDEEEWEETGRNLKAPTAQLSNGAIQQIMPSDTIRTLNRMDDGQAWLRSTWLRSQEVAPDNNIGNTRYTCLNQLLIRYDNYVSCGVACAIVGANFVDHYTTWAEGANDIINQKDRNLWGTVHEINHHHQGNWGFASLDGALSEATNNVLNTYEYTYQSSQSGNRYVDSSLTPMFIRDHMETVHPYYLFFSDQGDYFREGEWDLIYHCLGYKVFKNYMMMATNNSPYSSNKYNDFGKHLLTLMEATGYDCYEYCNYYCQKLGRKSPKELLGDQFDAFWETYTHHPAYHNYLHIMGCFYASGFVRNNERFETARPFKIYPFYNTTFDFNKALKYFEGNKTYFGDFVFDRIQAKRQSAWTEISKGVYTYKPVDDLTFIDEALAIYIDLTTNKEFICIVKLELKPSRKVHEVSIYNFTSDVCNRGYQVTQCYQNIQKQTLIKNLTSDASGIPSYKGRNLTLITDIVAQPTKSGYYRVGATISERGLIYFSNKPLTGDYDKDAPYLVLMKGWYFASSNSGPINESVYINASEKLYIRMVVNNADDPEVCTPEQTLCRPDVGGTIYLYNKADKEGGFGEEDQLPDEWFAISKPMDFAPSLIDFKYGNEYTGSKIIPDSSDNWYANVSMQYKNVITLTNTGWDSGQGLGCMEGCTDENVSQTILGFDDSTEVRAGWYPEWKQCPFPHLWDINFNEEVTFDAVFLKGAANENFYGMNSTIAIYLNSKSSSSVGIENEENLIWEGSYISNDNEPIKLDHEYTGKYIRIVVFNNSKPWKDGIKGQSSFSYISIGKYVYTTNYKAPRNCDWEVRKDGYYLNGRAFVGKAGDSYTYVPEQGINQVAIVGDRFEGMGTANVYLDDKLVKVISSADITSRDIKAMQYSSRSYMQILYVTSLFNDPPEIRIDVVSGEFRLTGFIVGSLDDDSSSLHNGPMPTQTPTAFPQQTSTPAPTHVPGEPTPLPPTEEPVIDYLPSVDSSNKVSSDEIIFTDDGFKYGGNKIDTTAINKDIILISNSANKITLKTETLNAPSQDKYVSLMKPNTVITIQEPESGSFGNSELGIHPNSQDPKIQISTAKVPLNIYSDSENSISFEPAGKSTLSTSISIGKITSTKGHLEMNAPEYIQHFKASEIDLYNTGEIVSNADGKTIDTVVDQVNLKEGAQSTISNVNINKALSQDANSKLIVNGKAKFDSESIVSLTDSSSIEFGDSDVEGVCKSLKLVKIKNDNKLMSDEATLICGKNFDCESWRNAYSGDSEYPGSKCIIDQNGEYCLVAYKAVQEPPTKGDDGNGKDKKKDNKKVIIIAASCAAAAVAIIIIIVVSVVVVRKKKASGTKVEDAKNTENVNSNANNEDPQDSNQIDI